MSSLQPKDWTNSSEIIPVGEGIGFLVSYINIKRQGLAWLCSLSGEFMEEKKEEQFPFLGYRPLNPRMPYSMTNVQVTRNNPRDFLPDIYFSLRQERGLEP